LWATEQILRAGGCGALLFCAQYVQTSSLRRLHLAAQASETLFFMVRPLAAAQDASLRSYSWRSGQNATV